MAVLDPYRPANYEVELEKLGREIRDSGDALRWWWLVGMTFPAALAGGVIGGLAALVGAFWSATMMAFLVTGSLTFLAAEIFLIVVYLEDRRDRRRYAALKANNYEVKTPADGNRLLQSISDNLRTLPQAQRDELRPLWAAALEANALLVEIGPDRDAMKRLRDRDRAIQDYIKTYHEMEKAAALAAAEDKRNHAISKYRSDDDSDLDLIRIHTEALAEGRRRYQELTGPEAR